MGPLLAMEGLAPVDGWVVSAILAKAMGYAVALVAAGGVLYLAVFPETPEPVRRSVRRWTLAAAALGLAVLLARFGLRSARISGMGFDGAVDPLMLGLVWNSPLGNSALIRIVGYAGVLALFLPEGAGRWLAVAGAGAIATSYAFVGHSLGDPRWVLGTLLVLHLLAVAFWVGALMPLWRVAGHGEADANGTVGSDILHRFGRIAAWIVSGLIVIGLVYAWYLSGSPFALLGTAYGAILLAKVAAVGFLLGLAALNKLRLVPAIAAGHASGASALRRSIGWEAVTVAFILFLTATMTSVTVPPVNL